MLLANFKQKNIFMIISHIDCFLFLKHSFCPPKASFPFSKAILFTYTKRSFTLLLQKTHFSILLHLSSELLINKLSTGEGRVFHHYIHRIAYVSVSAILSCRPFFILIFLLCITMKHYGFSRKSIWKNLETFP